MSKITDAYDKIVTEMGTLFPSHTRLTNPYEIQENNEQFLENGWGIAVESTSNVSNVLGCSTLRVNRSVTLSLTTKYFATEFNVDGKATSEKALLENQFTMIKHFDPMSSLDGLVTDFKYESDNGIEFVFGSKNQFLVTRSVYSLDYTEQLV